MYRLATLLLSLLLLCGAVAAQTEAPYTFQDNVLGVTTFQEFSTHLSPEAASTMSDYMCKFAINGLRSCKLRNGAERNYWFVDDKLAVIAVEFNSASDLESLLHDLSTKFGHPTKTVVPYQNGFGASRTGRVWNWRNKFGGIRLEEIGRQDLDTGTMTFYDSKLENEFLNRFHPKPTI